MRDLRLSVRLDLANGKRIGPGKIELLEAIRFKGSITVAAQHLGMSYRLAWVLVQQINDALQQPIAVTTSVGGSRGSSGAASPQLARRSSSSITRSKGETHTSAHQEFSALGRLVRRE